MSDAEIVSSLGYAVESEEFTGYYVCNSNGQAWLDAANSKQKAIEEFCAAPAMWLHLDDALAKGGWGTSLFHDKIIADFFDYNATRKNSDDDEPESIAAQGATRTAAVREVYESIIAKEGKEEG